jgi:phage-related protein (TIGR01555 family)
VLPKGDKMAMDKNIVAWNGWAGSFQFSEGLEFLGYPYLAELAQRPEYRRAVEVIATEMTRKWIKFEAASDSANKSDKIKKIENRLKELKIQEVFKRLAEQDGFFGRSHLYLDQGYTDDPDELVTPIGDGRNSASKGKVGKKKPITALRCVEAVWTYPTNYNSSDPLSAEWYKPDIWFVMGKRIHVSRLLCFIGREVPDLLKPAYSFGGLALTQMMKPYVDNWLQTRQSVNDAISAYHVFVLATQMGEILQQGGERLLRRMELFNNFRNNRGSMVIDKDSEVLTNVSAPLGGLEALQAQSQEHMSSVTGIPLIKLLGIQPAGLNASSEGEIRAFYDWIEAYQKAFFGTNLQTVIDFVQLSEFGEVDEEITWSFVPLWSLDELSQASLEDTQAKTDQTYVDLGAVAPEEVRKRLAEKPDSPYHGLEGPPPNLFEEEAQGLEPEGGRPQVAEQEEVE